MKKTKEKKQISKPKKVPLNKEDLTKARGTGPIPGDIKKWGH